MATYTTNFNLKKPAGTDSVAISDINGNMDIIDNELGKRPVMSAGTGIALSNVTGGKAIELSNSGATAGSYGPSADVTGNEGTSIKVPRFTVDATGRVTSITEKTYTSKNTTYSAGNGISIENNQIAMSGTFIGNFEATKVYNAVWNDYAEFRKGVVTQGGWCVRETEEGIMTLSTKRLQPGCRLTSDTYGHIMGMTKDAQTPVAVAGRVLAVPSNRHKRSKWKIGKAVCSGCCGTVDIMSRLECILFPDRIIGYVSEIPDYDIWLAGDEKNPLEIPVDGRIWVYVR